MKAFGLAEVRGLSGHTGVMVAIMGMVDIAIITDHRYPLDLGATEQCQEVKAMTLTETIDQ